LTGATGAPGIEAVVEDAGELDGAVAPVVGPVVGTELRGAPDDEQPERV
jgi:hypothetical protein